MEDKKKKYYIFKLNLKVLNVFSFILLIIVVLIGLLCYRNVFKDYANLNLNPGLFLIFFLGYMILHEILHSISYVIHGASFKKITYGINLEKSVLCCLCKQNITKKNILFSLLYPLFFIGIVTFVVAALFKLPILYLLSIINISGCIGDIVMFMFIIKLDNNIMYAEFDDPTSFAIYSSKDLSNTKAFGIKYDSVSEKLEQKDFKKVNVSKQSILYLIGLVLLSIIMMIPMFLK